jgi:hypothetical protein
LRHLPLTFIAFFIVAVLLVASAGWCLGASIGLLYGEQAIELGNLFGSAAGLLAAVIGTWKALEGERPSIIIKKPPDNVHKWNLVAHDTTGYYPRGAWAELRGTITPEQIRVMAAMLIHRPSFAVRRFKGKGRLFTEGQYYAMREFLEGQEIIQWRNPDHVQAGNTLSPNGVEMLKSAVGVE